MKMWNKVLSLLMVMIMTVGVLSGCGSAGDDSAAGSDTATEASKTEETKTSESSSTSSEEKTKIVWWTHQRHDMDYMQELIDQYMADHPNVEIEYVIQTDNYAQNLELSFQSNQAPDIFSMRNNAMYYTDRDMIAPITDYLTDDHYERFGDLLEVETGSYMNGETYSMPNFGNIFRFVYNKDLMDKAGITEVPSTLSELVEAARLMTEAGADEGQYGFAINLKTPGGAFARSIDKIAEASGLQPYDYVNGVYDFSSMKPIIMAFEEMYANGWMFPGVEALSMDPLRSQFADGKIGSYLSAHWEVGVYNNQFPTEVNWAAAEVPVVDGTEGQGKVGISKVGYWLGISSQSEVKDEAFEVLDFMYSQENLVGYHDRGLGFSIVPSVLEDVAEPTVVGAADFQFNTEIDKVWETAPATFGFCSSYALKPEGKPYSEVFTNVIIGATDIDEAIEDLNKRYNAAYDQAIEKGEMERIIIPDFDASK